MADAAGVQRARDHAGGDEGGGMAILRDPPGRVRPPGQSRLHEGRAALGGRHRREPVAGAPDQVLVPGVRLVQDAQRHLGGGRLAAGRAAVRLERVAEPAVVIAVGGHRVPHRRGRPVLEQPLEAAPVKHPGVGGDEGGGRVEVWSIHRPIRPRAAPRVLNETAVADILVGWMSEHCRPATPNGPPPPPCGMPSSACGRRSPPPVPTGRASCCPTGAPTWFGSKAGALSWPARTPARCPPR